MIDKRFSSGAFASRGLDSEAARELADQLADEIANEMHEVVKHHFLKIVGRLNTWVIRSSLMYPSPERLLFGTIGRTNQDIIASLGWPTIRL